MVVGIYWVKVSKIRSRKMHVRKTAVLSFLVIFMAFVIPVAYAVVVLVETSTDDFGVDPGNPLLPATTVTWDSSFLDTDYTINTNLVFTVNWTVDKGTATFSSFALKSPRPFSPNSKKDPVDGILVSAVQAGDSVVVTVKFTDLHTDSKQNAEIGNAHFKLFLNVDTDGDGVVDTVEGFGVNLHVSDPV